MVIARKIDGRVSDEFASEMHRPCVYAVPRSSSHLLMFHPMATMLNLFEAVEDHG